MTDDEFVSAATRGLGMRLERYPLAQRDDDNVCHFDPDDLLAEAYTDEELAELVPELVPTPRVAVATDAEREAYLIATLPHGGPVCGACGLPLKSKHDLVDMRCADCARAEREGRAA